MLNKNNHIEDSEVQGYICNMFWISIWMSRELVDTTKV